MRIIGFDHLVLTVASLERAAAFYTRVLGMGRETSGDGRTALRFAHHTINLHEAPSAIEPRALRPEPGSADLCLIVSDLDAVARHLLAEGVALVAGPATRTGAKGRMRSLYVRDPDGNLIELSADDQGPHSSGLELLTPAEMGQADALTIASGVTGLTLMEHAGRAVADEALRMLPADGSIVVLCGPGNNGGDGFVAARLIAEAGVAVRLCLLGERDTLRGDAAAMASRWAREIEPFAPDVIAGADLIIDAIFGAGLSRPVEGAAARMIAAVNAAAKPVLAVDVPSGLDGETGEVKGLAVQATRTVTFFRRKPGHLLMPGRQLCGPVVVADIGIPDGVLETVRPMTSMNAPQLWSRALLDVRPDGHKYDRGHATVVSGPAEGTGAARLAARGALRIGAGLVSVAAPAGQAGEGPAALLVNAAHLTAIMVKPFAGASGLAGLMDDPRRNALLIGPGAGIGQATAELVLAALASAAALVLDADALTSFAEDDGESDKARSIGFVAMKPPGRPSRADLFEAIAARRDRAVVMTPHEGEFRRLFPELAGSKLERTRQAARMSGSIVLLKGSDTVIASPEGQAVINGNAPQTLATAGSGDVLAGFILGLLARRMRPLEAAGAAVWLHGACAARFGPGLIAEDLPELLPAVLADLAAAHSPC